MTSEDGQSVWTELTTKRGNVAILTKNRYKKKGGGGREKYDDFFKNGAEFVDKRLA